MFLEVIRRRNPELLRAAITLHQQGAIPPNCYVIDLDAVTRNARRISDEAARLGLEVFAMTKQVGRGAPFADAIRDGGIDEVVAVDLTCALAASAAGLQIAHIGHLVQVPTRQAELAASLAPANWTVFSDEKANEAAAAAAALGRTQDVLARVVAPNDFFYRGHEGGFDAEDAVAVAERIDELPGGRFAGVTTFPALLFDSDRRQVAATPNLATVARVADDLVATGRDDVRVNAPGTTSTSSLGLLADAGATQVEPGHGLTGTTPAHAFQDLPEEPAVLYLSEVSHHAAGRWYCFGGGLYVDPVLGDYEVRALVSAGEDPEGLVPVAAELPPPAAIDYYAMLAPPRGVDLAVGSSVVFGFRIQAFVTRALIVGLRGVGRDAAEIVGAWHPDGRAASLGSVARPASASGAR